MTRAATIHPTSAPMIAPSGEGGSTVPLSGPGGVVTGPGVLLAGVDLCVATYFFDQENLNGDDRQVA
jgi:hypothetical protein